MPIQTVFLDAGGVLVNPNWSRVSETLGRHGVAVSGRDARGRRAAREEAARHRRDHPGDQRSAARLDLFQPRADRSRHPARATRPPPRSPSSTRTIRRTTCGRRSRTRCGRRSPRCAPRGLRLVVAVERERHAAPRLRSPRADERVRRHLRLAQRRRREAGSALLPASRSNAPAPTPRRPCTSATSTTWTSPARAPPASRRRCSTSAACIPTATACACAR